MRKLLFAVCTLSACGVLAKPYNPIREIPKEISGRAVDTFWQESDPDWGYVKPQHDFFIVEHPAPAKDAPGRPLLVVMHSSGQSCLSALLTTDKKDNHDIYKSPDDFYVLFLDCRVNQSEDWWWGYQNRKGFDLSPCEHRLLESIEFTVTKFGIDRDRIYLCGNSMGGSGCLGFGLRHGNIFAAIKANVPALVEHACDRMGFDGVKATSPIPDPPILVNHTAPNDMRWSAGQERLIRMMHDRKYAFIDYWADHKHCNKNSIILSKIDLYDSFDWLQVRKSDIYPVFTDASTDTPSPWPSDRERPGAGQINAFFRWSDASDTAGGASIRLFVADLKSRSYVVPSEATAAVTFRRLKNLKPAVGDTFAWTFGDKSGEVTVGADGLVTVPGLLLTRVSQELKVVRLAKPGYDTFIAHRGESVDAPENTLPAYRMAVDRGFGFECDIYLSKDGQVFTFHDDNLSRTTGGACSNKCSEANWSDCISRLDVGSWGRWKGSKYAGTRPALLKEVLELARDGRQIYIEVKPGPEIVPYIKAILEAQSRATPSNVLFISFNSASCKELKRLLPAYKVYWLTCAREGGKPVSAEKVLAALRETGADGVDCRYDRTLTTPAFVSAIRDAGYEFHVWTVDYLPDAERAFRCGVQTVTTNCAKGLMGDYEEKLAKERMR